MEEIKINKKSGQEQERILIKIQNTNPKQVFWGCDALYDHRRLERLEWIGLKS